MAVRAKNVPASKIVNNVATEPAPVPLFATREIEVSTALSYLLRGGPNTNTSEASRIIAKARFAGVNMEDVQRQCFDRGVSGSLMKRAFALSKVHTPESLAQADAAASALQSATHEERRREIKAARDKANGAPLTVKMFALELQRKA